MEEVWREVPGYEGIYSISNKGNVWKHERTWFTGKYKLEMRAPAGPKFTFDSKGYRGVQLTLKGRCKNYTVHRLVALAFLENPNQYPTVNHIDGDKQNNNVWNLEWASYSQNCQHAYDTGLSRKQMGSVNSNALLTEEDVLQIRNFYTNELKAQKELASLFNVKEPTINDIINNRTWTHIKLTEERPVNLRGGTCGYKWVTKHGSRFIGSFTNKGRRIYCGLFSTAKEAYDAVLLKREEVSLK